MKSPFRQWLLEFIERHPGLGLRSISRAAGRTRGTVAHHLSKLQHWGAAYAKEDGRVTRYFSALTDQAAADAIMILRRGRVREVVEMAQAHPGTSQAELALRLNMGRRVLRLYADLLVADSLLDERHDGAKRRYYPTSKLEKVLPLLEQPAPPSGRPPGTPPTPSLVPASDGPEVMGK